MKRITIDLPDDTEHIGIIALRHIVKKDAVLGNIDGIWQFKYQTGLDGDTNITFDGWEWRKV